MPLSRFRLHCGERFRYEYDFTADWKLDIRLERALPLIQNALFRHASTEGELRRRKIVLEPGIYLKRLDWRRSHVPIDELHVMAEAIRRFLIPMATATLWAISTNCAKRSIA